MTGGLWTIGNYPSTATQATATQAAPSTAAENLQNRLRSLTVTASGAAAAATGIIKVVVIDGASGGTTYLWQGTIQAPQNDSAIIALSDLDLRASKGAALTIETTGAGAAGTQLSVSASGDIVPVGYPAYSVANAT